MAGAPLSLFISYSRTDSKFVDRLEADLKARGFNTWVDRNNLTGGDQWLKEIQKQIDQCHICLVVISSRAIASEYVSMEYGRALRLKKRVIPVYWRPIGDEEWPIDLERLQRIEFYKNYKQGLSNLLTALSHQKSVELANPKPQTVSINTNISEQEPVLAIPQPVPPLLSDSSGEAADTTSPSEIASPPSPPPSAAKLAGQRPIRLRTGILIGFVLVTLLASGLEISTLFHQSPKPSASTNPRATPTSTLNPTSTQASCGGVDITHTAERIITVNDPDGLRNETSSGQQSFDNQVREAFADYSNRTASLAQIYGGGGPSTGVSFAQSATDALRLLEDQNILFASKYTLFQRYWESGLGNNVIRMSIVFYYEQCPSA